MAKVLRCRDVGMDCDFVAQADTEEEILQRAAVHACMVHNMHSILKFFQVDITGTFRMTSCARYFKAGVGSSRPN